MKSIETKELITAIEELEKERGISKEYLLSSLETALVTAYKRNFDSAENVKVNMDENTGDIKVYAVKTVVEEVLDDQLEISLEEAKKENKNAFVRFSSTPLISVLRHVSDTYLTYFKNIEGIDAYFSPANAVPSFITKNKNDWK